MNDQQIYALMANMQNIRAVQICDALDVELVDVSDALKSLVSVGDVVRHTGVGPNGLPAQMYNLSADFKKSREGIALLASVPAAAALPAPSVLAADPLPAVPPPAAIPAPPVSTPVFGQQAELALAHVKAHGAVSDTDMRTVMGLPKTSAPKAYLISAIKDGRIRKNDVGLWEQGDGARLAQCAPKSITITPGKGGPVAQFPKTAQPENTANVVLVGDTILLSKDHEAIAPEVLAAVASVAPTEVKDLQAAITEQHSAPPAGAAFRCGVWSDGVLELQREGRPLVELTRDEGEHLARFMGRLVITAD